MLLYSGLTLRSFVNLDLARDMRVAADIVGGHDYPLLGPLLGYTVRLGPGWYYLLAAFQLLTGSWSGTFLAHALLASVQFPLAYLAGKAWAGRGAGIAWAVLLVVPSWSTFEQLYPSHTQLTGATVAAFLLCAFRYYRNGKARYLAGAGLAASLALHAHPSTIVLSAVTAALLVLAWRRRRLSPGMAAGVLIVAAVPFVPLLVHQWLHGPSFLGSVDSYVASNQFRSAALANVLPLSWQLVGGGVRYWSAAIIGLPDEIGLALALACAATLGAGMLGAVAAGARGDRVTTFALLLLPAWMIALALIRDHFPYYMLTGARVLMLGIVSVGLLHLVRDVRWRRLGFALLALSSVAAYLSVGATVVRLERQGNWPFAFLPLFDVKNAWQPTSPLALMSARGMAASGRWLCSAGRVALHGSYAVHLIHSYAQDSRPYCDDAPLVVGGGDPLRHHWLGVSAAMARGIGREHQVAVGPFRLYRARRTISTSAEIGSVNRLDFPPLRVAPPAKRPTVYEVDVDRSGYIAVTNFAFGFVDYPAVRVFAGESELQPIASDWTTRVFSCGNCASPRLRVEVGGVSAALVDVVVF